MIYHCPGGLQEVFSILQRSAGDVQFLAGGTDLMLRYEHERLLPETLIDLKKIEGLRGIRQGEDTFEIGALTAVEDLRKHEGIASELTALHEAAEHFAGQQIRHRASIGGNICNASPAGDLLPGLYAFGAELLLESASGTRKLAISDFIKGPGKTALRPGELLRSIRLPREAGRSLFYKIGLRRSMAIAVVNCAIVYRVLARKVEFKAITAGAVAPTVVSLEQFTKVVNRELPRLEAHLKEVVAQIAPISDIRASAEYRRKVLINILRHVVTKLTKENNV